MFVIPNEIFRITNKYTNFRRKSEILLDSEYTYFMRPFIGIFTLIKGFLCGAQFDVEIKSV